VGGVRHGGVWWRRYMIQVDPRAGEVAWWEGSRWQGVCEVGGGACRGRWQWRAGRWGGGRCKGSWRVRVLPGGCRGIGSAPTVRICLFDARAVRQLQSVEKAQGAPRVPAWDARATPPSVVNASAFINECQRGEVEAAGREKAQAPQRLYRRRVVAR